MADTSRPPVFAHSAPGRPKAVWELLPEHTGHVMRGAAERAAAFGFADIARVAGQLHDVGKCSSPFQAYIRGDETRGPNHAFAGARTALALYPGPLGRILAHLIAGHHAGLTDGDRQDLRLDPLQCPVPAFDGWEAQVGPLPEPRALAAGRLRRSSRHRGFSESFLIRLLFSALIDADCVGTEGYYARLDGRDPGRGGFTPLATLRARLDAHMAATRPEAPSRLDTLRAQIRDHVLGRAGLPTGLFTLTVPTGGGKTLTSLSFALEHARRHGLRRVVYVIPFTSIIEQTAEVFRNALGTGPGQPNRDDVLEHHTSFDWDAAARHGHATAEDGRGPDPAERLRRAAENWEAPVVVTTAVQFFESLFANRGARCRKLHNLAGSVIVLDEAQTLPLHLLRPCMAALDELADNYGSSVVLCTATQPALRACDGFEGGFAIDDTRELAPDPPALYTALKRVAVERRASPVPDAEIAARFAEQPQMLCIVNTRAHARALFELIRPLPGAVHLTTLMCPAHRRQVLAEARARLEPKRGEPVRIVATSLIEAGVDIDLPEVWRAAAGIDSLAQAAGRCNREGRMPDLGRLVVFEPEAAKAPPDLEQAWAAGRAVLRQDLDPLGLEAVRAYFRDLYWQRGPEALDSPKLDGAVWPILRAIRERAPTGRDPDSKLAFPFDSIARAFRIIDTAMEPVIVPWRAHAADDAADRILDRIAAIGPSSTDLRRLQQYVVAIPKGVRAAWLRDDVLRPVYPALGDTLLRFADLAHYDRETGVRLGEPDQRDPGCNIL